jgi:hypothetical protein
MKKKYILTALVILASMLFAGCPTDDSGAAYTVSFNRGEGTGTAPANQSVVAGAAITLPGQGSMIAPKGKSFYGWIYDHIIYAEGSLYKEVSTDLTFTALWKSESAASDDGKTYVEFTNAGQFPVGIFKDPARLTEILRVPAEGSARVEAEPNSAGTAFYPRFYLTVLGIAIPQNGSAFTMRIDEKKINKANIPALTTVETEGAYIRIENKSGYSLTLNRGNSEIQPWEGTSTIVMPNETALYVLEPGNTSLYTVMQNTVTPISWPSTASGFEKGFIYSFQFNGISLSLDHAGSIQQALTPPPSGLTDSARSMNSITLRWTAVDKALSYKVYRSGAADGTYTGVGSSTAASYTDNGLAQETTYYYRVTAVNNWGESEKSLPVSGTTTPPPPSVGMELSAGQWTSNVLSSESQVQFYYFLATSGKNYTIRWNDKYQGDNTKTCYTRVTAYWYSDNVSIFDSSTYGYTEGKKFTASRTGYVVIKVIPWRDRGTGSYAVLYE